MTNGIGIVVSDMRAKRQAIKESLLKILGVEESTLPGEFGTFKTAVSDAIRILDETIEAHSLGNERSARK